MLSLFDCAQATPTFVSQYDESLERANQLEENLQRLRKAASRHVRALREQTLAMQQMTKEVQVYVNTQCAAEDASAKPTRAALEQFMAAFDSADEHRDMLVQQLHHALVEAPAAFIERDIHSVKGAVKRAESLTASTDALRDKLRGCRPQRDYAAASELAVQLHESDRQRHRSTCDAVVALNGLHSAKGSWLLGIFLDVMASRLTYHRISSGVFGDNLQERLGDLYGTLRSMQESRAARMAELEQEKERVLQNEDRVRTAALIRFQAHDLVSPDQALKLQLQQQQQQQQQQSSSLSRAPPGATTAARALQSATVTDASQSGSITSSISSSNNSSGGGPSRVIVATDDHDDATAGDPAIAEAIAAASASAVSDSPTADAHSGPDTDESIGACDVSEIPVTLGDPPSGYVYLGERRALGTGWSWSYVYAAIHHNTLTLQRRRGDTQPRSVVPLSIATVKLGGSEPNDRPFTFHVISPRKTLVLQAEDSLMRTLWVDALREAITSAVHSTEPHSPSSGQSVSLPLSSAAGTPGMISSSDEPDGSTGASSDSARTGPPRRHTIDLIDVIMSNASNQQCADCGVPQPQWASISIGVTLCLECSAAHRSLGTHISQVRSIRLDRWSNSALQRLLDKGNDAVNAELEHAVTLPRPTEQSSREDREQFIRHKYIDLLFCAPSAKERIFAERTAWMRDAATPQPVSEQSAVTNVPLESHSSASASASSSSSGRSAFLSRMQRGIKSIYSSVVEAASRTDIPDQHQSSHHVSGLPAPSAALPSTDAPSSTEPTLKFQSYQQSQTPLEMVAAAAQSGSINAVPEASGDGRARSLSTGRPTRSMSPEPSSASSTPTTSPSKRWSWRNSTTPGSGRASGTATPASTPVPEDEPLTLPSPSRRERSVSSVDARAPLASPAAPLQDKAVSDARQRSRSATGRSLETTPASLGGAGGAYGSFAE